MSKSAVERIGEFNRFGSVLGLERMDELLETLGDPQDGMNIIHVAGTNGKGSTCKFIYEILRSAGYKVGLYSSPFIQEFNERIALDGKNISDEDLEHYADTVIGKTEEIVAFGHDSPTEFEVVTAIALEYFKDNGADIVILEVGLGGRGDSTNVIKRPWVSVITSIDYDHMDRLGDSLEAIAGEKAGIIKAGVPVISNVAQRSAAKPIARKAYECGAVLHDISRIKPLGIDGSLDGQMFDLTIGGEVFEELEISMLGKHQLENAKTALCTIENLRMRQLIEIKKSNIYEGLKRAKQPGRLEVIGAEPYIILDGAHNKAGAVAFRETIEAVFDEKARILMVMGMLADKDVDGMIEEFKDVADEFILTEINDARSLKAEELAEHMKRTGKNCSLKKPAAAAVEEAVKRAGDFDVLLIAGSLYLIGEIRGLLISQHIW